jgi:hypothetical protein
VTVPAHWPSPGLGLRPGARRGNAPMEVINMLEKRKALHTEYANSLETNASFTSSTSMGLSPSLEFYDKTTAPKSPAKKDAIDSPLDGRPFSYGDSVAERSAADLRPLDQFRILAGIINYHK